MLSANGEFYDYQRLRADLTTRGARFASKSDSELDEIRQRAERLKKELGMSVLLITHDLGIVAEVAQRVAVMYAGRIVEMCGVERIFERPYHPYTVGLLNSLPRFGQVDESGRGRLNAIPGTVPTLLDRTPGCAFAERCDRAIDVCPGTDPPLEEVEPGHWAACFNPAPAGAGAGGGAGEKIAHE